MKLLKQSRCYRDYWVRWYFIFMALKGKTLAAVLTLARHLMEEVDVVRCSEEKNCFSLLRGLGFPWRLPFLTGHLAGSARGLRLPFSYRCWRPDSRLNGLWGCPSGCFNHGVCAGDRYWPCCATSQPLWLHARPCVRSV